MQISLQTPHALPCSKAQISQISTLSSGEGFHEVRYRWIIVILMGLCQILIGLANNAIIPLEQKVTVTYGLSETKVSISIILSFLVFSIVNFPANHIIDERGLRVSFLVGAAFYTIGTLCYVLINQSYYFVIMGTIFMGTGQPFLMNCPAKVAAFWFFPKNRAFATAIMVGTNLFGVGIGFLVPTLAVSEESTGEIAKSQIWRLYLGYFIFSSLCLALNFIFMRSKPLISPSEGANAQKLSSTIESLKHIKKDRNLCFFFLAYFLSYGTFIAFASNCNFIIKPYGYTDVQIATNAIFLMLVGTCGAIAFSLFIKKTYNFSLAIRVISFGSTAVLGILCLWLNTINIKVVTTLIISIMGFILTPVVPISYDLGCELAFPIGEAQVTGLLNGGALLWAFISSTFITIVVGFGSAYSSLMIMVLLSCFILGGSVLFYNVKIMLKRHNYEQSKENEKNSVQNGEQQHNPTHEDFRLSDQQKQQRQFACYNSENEISAPSKK